MIKFERSFFKYLNEADITADRQAMRGMLDDGTDEAEFGVDMTADESQDMSDAAETMARIQQQSNAQEVKQILNWIDYLNDVVEELNGLESTSLQQTLAKAEPDSIMDKLKNESTTIKNICTNATKLAQALQAAVGQSGNAQLKNV